jgi:hypothetical protein
MRVIFFNEGLKKTGGAGFRYSLPEYYSLL